MKRRTREKKVIKGAIFRFNVRNRNIFLGGGDVETGLVANDKLREI